MEVKELSAISSDEIISILKEEIKNYDASNAGLDTNADCNGGSGGRMGGK